MCIAGPASPSPQPPPAAAEAPRLADVTSSLSGQAADLRRRRSAMGKAVAGNILTGPRGIDTPSMTVTNNLLGG